MKTRFYRFTYYLQGVSLLLCGIALVDFILNPLAPDFIFGSTSFRILSMWVATPLTLLVSFFIQRKRAGNVIGPLLVLWSGTVALNTLRKDTALEIFILFAIYELTLGWYSLFLMVMHFPNGKISPERAAPWIYRLFIVNILLGLLIFLSMESLSPIDQIENPFFVLALKGTNDWFGQLGIFLFLPVIIISIISPILHYRRGSAVERQQIKWMAIFALILSTCVLIAYVAYPLATGGDRLLGYNNLFSLVYFSFTAFFPPLAIGLAILRYHLWDIDLVIRRTLVYGGLTATLALIYFGGVVLLQGILSAITGESRSEIVTVATTLIIAALFTPLRKRIQHDIDRRFYRRKYNAEQTLANFAALARNETDLKTLTEQVVEIVEQTLQPSNASLWLKPFAITPQARAAQEVE
jgi:hypothetical protein